MRPSVWYAYQALKKQLKVGSVDKAALAEELTIQLHEERNNGAERAGKRNHVNADTRHVNAI